MFHKYNLVLLASFAIVILACLKSSAAESEVDDTQVRAMDVLNFDNENGQIAIKLDAATKLFKNFWRENMVESEDGDEGEI